MLLRLHSDDMNQMLLAQQVYEYLWYNTSDDAILQSIKTSRPIFFGIRIYGISYVYEFEDVLI